MKRQVGVVIPKRNGLAFMRERLGAEMRAELARFARAHELG